MINMQAIFSHDSIHFWAERYRLPTSKTIQITQNVGSYTSPMDPMGYRSPSQMELSEMGVWSLDRFGCQSSGTHTWIPSIN